MESPQKNAQQNASKPQTLNQQKLTRLKNRLNKTQDLQREPMVNARKKKGFSTARENLEKLCAADSFMEYGQLAVAAQRQRMDYEELQTRTAADGIITGVGFVNDRLISGSSKTALIINDYTVLAGTQGYYHHQKIDRMLHIARKQALPVIMYTEGGGGRPGDTDITSVNSGLQCASFSAWAGLSGIVPRIAVNNGYCFAGNAALFGAADITIATESSFIGMAGPAMIEGGGLGKFAPQEIGPVSVQSQNGTIDIVCKDEAEAAEIAKKCLSYFQGTALQFRAPEQQGLSEALPEDRRFTYDVRKIIHTIADQDSFTELKAGYGGAVVTGFIRIAGKPVGLIASDCKVMGGAIDVEAGEKATEFMGLCNKFNLPMVSLCDTPGFMVGPKHEALGAVRRLARMFETGAQLKVPLMGIILRKCYGLGAQALLSGSTLHPAYTVSWPNGEFGPMGLEGAVKLGFKKELDNAPDDSARQELYDTLLAQQYEKGEAIEVASVLEIDAVIDPVDTRKTIISFLNQRMSV